MPKINVLIMLLNIIPAILLGQIKAFPITLSLYNESTALPFTRFFTTPIHPGIQVGTEFNYKVKNHSRLFQTVNATYFYHQHLTQGIGLNTELGYEYRFNLGLSFSSLFGVGYLHSFVVSDEYILKNGEYIKKKDRGNARFCPSLSLELGYYFKTKNNTHPKLFARYQSWVEYPYSPGFIPIMTHINFHVGTKFFIPYKSSKNG